MHTDLWMGLAWCGVGMFLMRFALLRIFGRRIMSVVLVVGVGGVLLSARLGLAQTATFANVTNDSAWVNPSNSEDEGAWFAPIGYPSGWTAGTIANGASVLFNVNIALQYFVDPDTGNGYYVGYENSTLGGVRDYSGVVHVWGVMLTVGDKPGLYRAWVSTDYGPWREVFQGGYQTGVTNLSFSLNSLSGDTPIPEITRDWLGSPYTHNSFSLQFTGVVASGVGTTQPSTTQATTEDFSDPSATTQTVDASKMPVTRPASTLPWASDYMSKMGFDANDSQGGSGAGSGYMAKVRSGAADALGRSDLPGYLKPFPDFSQDVTGNAGDSSSWQVIQQKFLDLEGAVFPGASSLNSNDVFAVAMDHSIRPVLGLLFQGYSAAVQQLAPWLSFWSPLAQLALAFGVLWYGIQRLAWAFGLRESGSVTPPISASGFLPDDDADDDVDGDGDRGYVSPGWKVWGGG